MKTQVANLRTGVKNQILNSEIDYSKLPKASSHVGHSGSNFADVRSVWNLITSENPDSIKIRVKGLELELTASYSISGKTVSYYGFIPDDLLEDKFYLKPSKKGVASISIQDANIVVVHNGKSSYLHICPSLIEIV